MDIKDDIEKDYEYARQHYKDMISHGNEAIELLLDFVKESESPRAFEVFASLLKNNTDIADKFIDLQRKRTAIEKDTMPVAAVPASKNEQNNFFIGSTTDLQRTLINKMNEKLVPVEPDTITGTE